MQSDEKLAAYLAGMLPEEERLGFEEELLSDPEARTEVLNQQRISAGLKALLATDGERMAEAILAATRGVGHAPPAPRIMRARKGRSLWPARVLAVAAAVVLCAMLYRFLIPPEAARVSREIAAVWEGSAPVTGKKLRPGWLKLRRGAVELEFSRGAKVMVEGPAELQLISGREAFLRQGRLRAVVPERARGFTIRGDGFAAVDLGTEFGVIAGDSPEVHVFTGKVEFQGNSQLLLEEKEAVRVSGGVVESIPARSELFAGGKRLAAMEASAALDMHPATIIHYDFAAEGSMLRNRVTGREVTAEIAGCRATEGRWPGSQALEFGRDEDRVSFSIPGEMESSTLLAWVRVDALPNVQSSLLMGSSELPGDVHWYLHRSGVLGFAVVGSDGEWHRVQTPVVMRGPDFGQWKCLAVTFDGKADVVTHYLDGRVVASQPLGTSVSLSPGPVEVGNWALRPGATLRASERNSPVDFQRSLHGRMDELAIFSSALGAEEILRLSEAGKP